jgi:hypothetical protein
MSDEGRQLLMDMVQLQRQKIVTAIALSDGKTVKAQLRERKAELDRELETLRQGK